MGQIINVEVHTVDDESVRQFFMDRGLTGQGLLSYYEVSDATGDRPPDRLARRLFEIEGVTTVFAYDNVVSVTKADEASWEEIVPQAESLIRNLFIAYDVNRV